MNPLYAVEGIDDSLVMGHICFYTVTKPRVTHEDLEALVGTLGLSSSIVPIKPRAGDAFKRACRYSERKGLPIPLSPNTANMMIRTVTSTIDDIERHLVMEIVDPLDRVLEHTTVAHLRFDRKDEVLHVKKQNLDNTNLVEMVDETLNLFVQNLDDASKFIDAQVIRRMLREQLDLLQATSIRRHGSVYFVPKAYHEQVEALEELCDHFGQGSEFIAIPLPDGKKYRQMVATAFEAEVHTEATQAIAELKTIVNQESEITSRAFEEYMGRLKTLKARSGEYGELVEVETFKARAELKGMEGLLTEVLKNGQIKAPRGGDKK